MSPMDCDLDHPQGPGLLWTAINSRSQSSKTSGGTERKPNLSNWGFLDKRLLLYLPPSKMILQGMRSLVFVFHYHLQMYGRADGYATFSRLHSYLFLELRLVSITSSFLFVILGFQGLVLHRDPLHLGILSHRGGSTGSKMMHAR